MGRPDRIGLRFEGDGLGVGDAVAELGALSAPDGAGVGIKILNGEVLAAELLEGEAICLVLLARFFCGGAALDYAVVVPSRKLDQGDHESDDGKD